MEKVLFERKEEKNEIIFSFQLPGQKQGTNITSSYSPFQVCISDPAGNVKKNPPRDCPQLLSLGNTGVSAENGRQL